MAIDAWFEVLEQARRYGEVEGDIPPVALAVACTFIFSAQFFICYAAVQASRTFSQFTGAKMSAFENVTLTAVQTMNFAPMLAIPFISACMRALQMDSIKGSPQKWAQNCFYMCTICCARTNSHFDRE